MKFIIVFLISTCFSIQTFSQIIINRFESSSVVTKIMPGYFYNEGSSLKREMIVLNDTNCPIKLNNIEIVLQKKGDNNFISKGNLLAKEPIMAFELTHILYDVFGRYLRTLTEIVVKDINNQHTLYNDLYSWYASTNDKKSYLYCITFVKTVRLKNGKIWYNNFDALKNEIENLKFSFKESYLSQSKPSK